MKTRYVTIVLRSREEVSVPAYDTEVSGLVVHRAPNHWSMWNVTHERSGLAVGQLFLTRKKALEFANFLAEGIDRSADRDQIKKAVEPEHVFELERRCGGGQP
jgi:hypothetical protein